MSLGGSIEGGGDINSLGGVNITSPTNGQFLVYDSASGNWINSNGGGSTGYQTVQGQGVSKPQQTTLNFASNTFTVVDNPGSSRTDVFVSGVITWSVVAVDTGMVVQTGYINNSGSLITFTLPAAANPGDTVRIIGYGAGLWQIAQNAGQTIRFGNNNTTSGAGGSLAATNQGDCVEIVCVAANTLFVVGSVVGNLLIT